jgi:hypothetical protein
MLFAHGYKTNKRDMHPYQLLGGEIGPSGREAGLFT